MNVFPLSESITSNKGTHENSWFAINPLGFTRQRLDDCHAGGKQTPDTIAVNEILLFKFLQRGRHDVKCKPRIVTNL